MRVGGARRDLDHHRVSFAPEHLLERNDADGVCGLDHHRVSSASEHSGCVIWQLRDPQANHLPAACQFCRAWRMICSCCQARPGISAQALCSLTGGQRRASGETLSLASTASI
jgi:hypothetical protein